MEFVDVLEVMHVDVVLRSLVESVVSIVLPFSDEPNKHRDERSHIQKVDECEQLEISLSLD